MPLPPQTESRRLSIPSTVPKPRQARQLHLRHLWPSEGLGCPIPVASRGGVCTAGSWPKALTSPQKSAWGDEPGEHATDPQMARPLTVRRSHFEHSCIYPHDIFVPQDPSEMCNGNCLSPLTLPILSRAESLAPGGSSAGYTKPRDRHFCEVLSFMGSDSMHSCSFLALPSLVLHRLFQQHMTLSQL